MTGDIKKDDKCNLYIVLNGDTFKDINKIIDKEEKNLESYHILYSKMGDVYTEVFKCNDNISLVSTEVFGNIIIDDNHVVIYWEVFGRQIEFYFEQYWDIVDLSIEKQDYERTIKEIVIAFEKYYNKSFKYMVDKKYNYDKSYYYKVEIIDII